MEREAVAGGDEVNRRPHELRADRSAFGDQSAELLGIEVVEPRPERHVRVSRLLGLHAHEPLGHVDRGVIGPRQKPLPLQQCAVQRALGEDGGDGHPHAHSGLGSADAARASRTRTLGASTTRPRRRSPVSLGSWSPSVTIVAYSRRILTVTSAAAAPIF